MEDDFEDDWRLLRRRTTKVYSGKRLSHGCYVEVAERMTYNSVLIMTYPLPPRNDLVNHSPNGFEWGYGGSGPAQLSFALLLDYLGEKQVDRVRSLYQDFKFAIIGGLTTDDWILTEEQIEAILSQIGTGSKTVPNDLTPGQD